MAKKTSKQIVEVSCKEIVKIFNVSDSLIYAIKHERAWKDVTI